MKTRKKLIEVALPLEVINSAAAQEKGNPFLKGHPRNLHQWWARRPMAAARAVIFGQLVDDPSTYVEVLRQDAKLRRRAESVLRQRLKVWEEACALAKKVEGTTVQVPEPGPAPTLDDVLADEERRRLFRIIEDLVSWENTANEAVMQAARDEIWQSWRRACVDNAGDPKARELFDRNQLPAFHDPFAGGGALPLEAQRLGLESSASDLNPVAVVINKVLIEIPPRFGGVPPVNPEARTELLRSGAWHGKRAAGLAQDVRYYAEWIRAESEKRIGHLYPQVVVTADMAIGRADLKPMVGAELPVIAWLWARTVKSPDPAFAKVDVPLVSTFLLASKTGKEAYVEPVISAAGYRFTVKAGKPADVSAAKSGTKLSRGANFKCLMSGSPIGGDYIKAEGKSGRMGARLMAIVADGPRGRVYLSPIDEHEEVAKKASPIWKPETSIADDPRALWAILYGLTTFGDLFTARQLVALTTVADLVDEARVKVKLEAIAAGMPDDGIPLSEGGNGATAYADAVATIESLCVDKLADYNNALCTWNPTNQNIGHLFTKQALPMAWDYPETTPLTGGLSFSAIADGIARTIEQLPANVQGTAFQQDCATLPRPERPPVVSTDPPYYDNIGYADLSDFFYVWLRRSIRPVFPELFSTLAVPKAEELVATPCRHGSRENAENFFLRGMTRAMARLAEAAHPAFPVSIYYAFKQAEGDGDDGTTNTGWDTFLAAVIEAGFAISGTWPIRTERDTRSVSRGTNALASSIVLVCRPRRLDAASETRRGFMAALRAELPAALSHLQRSNIAPVDLAQAAIGPGMAVFTRYGKVVGAEGDPVSVREALTLINQVLDEALAEQEGDFDADSRWALTWFEQSGFEEGEYGVAEQLSKSKNTSVAGMVEAGIVASKRGKVRLLRPDELPVDWDPASDPRLTAWEIVHQLIRVLAVGGESAAAGLVAKIGARADIGRELAYRLYTLCERKKRSAEALAYNGLVQSWPEITRQAREGAQAKQPEAVDLFGQE